MATKNDDMNERVGELEDQIGGLTKANADLTEALKKAQQPSLPLQPPPGAVDAQLKKERDELQAKLKAAEDELAKAKAPPSEPETESSAEKSQLRAARAVRDSCGSRSRSFKSNSEAARRGRAADAITKVEKTWVLSVKAKDFARLPRYRQGARRQARCHGDCGQGADRGYRAG